MRRTRPIQGFHAYLARSVQNRSLSRECCASIRRDDDSTDATCGRDISTRRILSGDIAVPDSAPQCFIKRSYPRNSRSRAVASVFEKMSLFVLLRQMIIFVS